MFLVPILYVSKGKILYLRKVLMYFKHIVIRVLVFKYCYLSYVGHLHKIYSSEVIGKPSTVHAQDLLLWNLEWRFILPRFTLSHSRYPMTSVVGRKSLLRQDLDEDEKLINRLLPLCHPIHFSLFINNEVSK